VNPPAHSTVITFFSPDDADNGHFERKVLMSLSLPSHPNLEWLRKTAKQRLVELRAADPRAKLAEAQRAIAREYGLPSWRKLKAQVEAATVAPEPAPQPTADQIIKGFFGLVGAGRIDDVRKVLDAAPQMVNAVGPHPFWGGRPQALHVAIEGGRRDLFDLLLERGADVNGRNDEYDHWSPLMLAMNRDRGAMRDELLRRGARVGLIEALMMADDGRVDELIEANGLPAITPNGGSILAFARTTHAIDRLIALGANPEAKDRWGSTPLDAMSRLGARGISLVSHMIARGVTASPKEYAHLGDIDTLAAMVENDPAVARLDDVMLGAVDFRHYALVEWLLAHGANVNARAEAQSHHTALHSAAWNGDLRIVQLLIAAGADPSLLDEEHNGTPLQWAEVSAGVTNNPTCAEVADYLRTVGKE
jgi:ankyrin repeat protein